jgi:hypothetical protein
LFEILNDVIGRIFLGIKRGQVSVRKRNSTLPILDRYGVTELVI